MAIYGLCTIFIYIVRYALWSFFKTMVSFTCCIHNSWPAHPPGSTWILNFLSLVDMSCNFLHLGILMLTFAWEILSKSSKKGNLWLYEILLLFSYILVNEFYLLKWLYVFFCGIRISKAIFLLLFNGICSIFVITKTLSIHAFIYAALYSHIWISKLYLV